MSATLSKPLTLAEELETRNKMTDALKAAIETGNIDGFVTMCHEIVDKPTSTMPLLIALTYIKETARQPGFLGEDRKRVIKALRYVMGKATDNLTQNQLFLAIRELQCAETATVLKQAITVSPKTGLATFVAVCRNSDPSDIVAALYDITETAKLPSFPKGQRIAVIKGLKFVEERATDSTTQEQLRSAIRRLDQINSPGKYGDDEPKDRANNLYGGISKGKRAFSVTPKYYKGKGKGRR